LAVHRTESPPEQPQRLSKGVVRLLAAIVIGLAVVAIYANVQKLRRDKLENVTFIPASQMATPSPAPTR
jgi:hypothetical protein